MTRTKSNELLLAAILALAFAPLGARASDSLFEVTPFAGLRLGGDFKLDAPSRKLDVDDSGSFALALNLRIDEISQYELFFGHQSTGLQRDPLLGQVDIGVDYLHLGGTVALEGERRVIPYMAGGLGATRFSPDSSGASDKTRFSLSLGGGVKVPLSRRFALRLEGRGYLTFVDTDTAFFCRSDEEGGVCLIRGSGSTFFQYELLAGATFAF